MPGMDEKAKMRAQELMQELKGIAKDYNYSFDELMKSMNPFEDEDEMSEDSGDAEAKPEMGSSPRAMALQVAVLKRKKIPEGGGEY